MPDEPVQENYGAQAENLYLASRQAGNGPASLSYSLSSIAASLLRIGNLLEKWAQPPLLPVPQKADPPEGEIWYVGKGLMTTEVRPGLKGPFTKADAAQLLEGRRRYR